MSFLEQLVSKGIIKENQAGDIIRRAENKFGGDIDLALIEIGADPKSVLQWKSDYYGIPFRVVDSKSVSYDLYKYIPEDSALHYQIVPIGFADGVLEVGVVDPDNIGATDALQFISNKLNVPFKFFIISKDNFKTLAETYKGMTGEVDHALTEFDTDLNLEKEANEQAKNKGVKKEEKKDTDEEKIVEDAPIIKIVAVILRNAIDGNASDIHIENTGDKVKVRFRVDGVLHTSLVLPIQAYNGVIARIKILAKLRLDEKRKPQDGGFSATIENRKIDFRVSTLPAYYGEKAVLRILDSEKGVKALDALEMSPENLAMIKEALAKPFGLILITGPTGSGKTTTLYSMLNALDREKANIVSLEDPVEYHIPDVNQSQVMPEIGYTFASGLRSILRQDPDIIMVGEIRDKETAQLAIQAALTGHLVLSTLHTNNAIGVIPRLIDMGVDPYLIAPTLVLAIAQRLTRVICPTSKKPVPITDSYKLMIDKQFADLPEQYKTKIPKSDNVYEAVPSSECPSGTRGRVAVYEMFKIDKEIESVILKTPSEMEIYKVVRDKGMLSMREDAILKSMQGIVPFQEVYNL